MSAVRKMGYEEGRERGRCLQSEYSVKLPRDTEENEGSGYLENMWIKVKPQTKSQLDSLA